MNPIEKLRLKRESKRNYNNVIRNAGSDPIGRVANHLKNLAEYWIRWLGFCRYAPTSSPSLTDNALLFILETASEIAERDIKRLPDRARDSLIPLWHRYKESLKSLPKHPESVKVQAEAAYIQFQKIEAAFREIFGNEIDGNQ